MDGFDPRDVAFVLDLIKDGNVFESFGQEFLSNLIGNEFIPLGGIHDKGIDGLEYVLSERGREAVIYQLSIEPNAKVKIQKTVDALEKNNIEFKRLIYVTCKAVKNIYAIEEYFYTEKQTDVRIWDQAWFKAHINDSTATQNTFRRFQEEHLTKYNQPGVAYELTNLVADPRIYVFLRQQWDASQKNSNLEEVLADSLILFALEGTDPDKGILRSEQEIRETIVQLTHFDPKWLYPTIARRLKVLSTKPRRIRHHRRENAYCLPYETRTEIRERNIRDAAIYQKFIEASKEQLAELLYESSSCCVDDLFELLKQVLHDLFKEQGLEFAEFLNTGDSKHSVEKSMSSIISATVNSTGIAPVDQELVKDTLLNCIRKIVYQGSEAQQEYLRRLADTYKMLFLLQCDPQLATYFAATASKLRVYVDNSILIPALSEKFLDENCRRHWNLLLRANQAGVTLLVNEIIIRELSYHFRRLAYIYRTEYAGLEDIYSTEEAVIYIPDILIRAFFYARINKKIDHFEDFMKSFIPLDMQSVEEDLTHWLFEAFGITYESSKNLNLEIDSKEEDRLYEELKKLKASDQQARSDARQLLIIYALRERDNEAVKPGVFGYKTWWLTTDINTEKAHQIAVGNNVQYQTSPYMRADFLYNYITLAPSRADVDTVYKEVFPTLLGVQISYHIPPEIGNALRKYIKEHKESIGKPELKVLMRKLSNRLKSAPNQVTREKVDLWLDEMKAEWTANNN